MIVEKFIYHDMIVYHLYQKLFQQFLFQTKLMEVHLRTTHISPTFTNNDVNYSVIFMSIVCLIAAFWALFNWIKVNSLPLDATISKIEVELTENINKVAIGTRNFIIKQFSVCAIAVGILFFIILGAAQKFKSAYISLSFLFGAILAMLCSFLCIEITKRTNFRIISQGYNSINQAFKAIYQATSVIGFLISSILLFVLLMIILIFKQVKVTTSTPSQVVLPIIGYGLGICTVTLFSRFGGGIFSKAADIGADLHGRVRSNIEQDHSSNPGVISDLIGDNVGSLLSNILQISSISIMSLIIGLISSSFQANSSITLNNLLLPIINLGAGILICIIANAITIYAIQVNNEDQIKKLFIFQFLSTNILQLFVNILSSYLMLPTQNIISSSSKGWGAAYFCQFIAIIGSLLIGTLNYFLLSPDFKPIHDIVNSCKTGVPTNIIYGLSLGMLTTIIPSIIIGLIIYGCNLLLGFYGVALGAASMVSNLPLLITITIYQNLSDNNLGLSMYSNNDIVATNRFQCIAVSSKVVNRFTKGLIFGVSTISALSVYTAYISQVNVINNPNLKLGLTEPAIFTGLLFGAMIPYLISSFLIKSTQDLGTIFLSVLNNEYYKQQEFNALSYRSISNQENKNSLEYQEGLRESFEWKSITAILLPAIITIFIPIILGLMFGARVIIGFIPGIVLSAFNLNITQINTGDAWNTVNKYIEYGRFLNQKNIELRQEKQIYKTSIIGDIVGDALKDISGPSMNTIILIITSISMIFGGVLSQVHS